MTRPDLITIGVPAEAPKGISPGHKSLPCIRDRNPPVPEAFPCLYQDTQFFRSEYGIPSNLHRRCGRL